MRLKRIAYRFLPGICILCQELTNTDKDLCSSCESELPWLKQPYCEICSLPLKTPSQQCRACTAQRPAFDQCQCAFIYQYPVDQLLLRFKDNRKLVYGHTLARLAAARVKPRGDMLVPVPLHWRKKLVRGFNQAREIADILSKHHAIPVADLVSRTSYRAAQKQLSKHGREANLLNAFSCSRSLDGLCVTIVDDVVTTGTTVKEMTSALLQAGASSCDVIGIARTPQL